MKLEVKNNKLYLTYNNYTYWTCIKYKIKENYVGISFIIIDESKVEFDEHIDAYPLTPLKEIINENKLEIRIKINRYNYGEKIEIYPKLEDRESLLQDMKKAFTLLKW